MYTAEKVLGELRIGWDKYSDKQIACWKEEGYYVFMTVLGYTFCGNRW